MIASVLAFTALCAAPGPAVLSITTAAMSPGRRAALAHMLGLSLSLAAWGALAAAGFSSLLTASAQVLLVLKICGAAVLLWMAFSAARSALSCESPAVSDVRRATSGWFWRGVLLNGLNPKVLVAWGAAFVIGASIEEVWIAWALCSISCVLVYTAYANVFSLTPMRRVYARARRIAETIAAAIFGTAAIELITWEPDTP